MADSLLQQLSLVSEDGQTYVVTPFEATTEMLNKLWDCVQKHEVLTSDFTKGNFAYFLQYVMSPSTVLFTVAKLDEDGEESEEVGVVYADGIVPGYKANGHFIFWDYKLAGRQSLLLQVMDAFMQEFDLVRLDVEIPVNAYSALRRIKNMGFKLEGHRRRAMRVKDEWIDSLLFGVLRDELTANAVREGSLSRDTQAASWYGLLDRPTALARHIIKEADVWEA